MRLSGKLSQFNPIVPGNKLLLRIANWRVVGDAGKLAPGYFCSCDFVWGDFMRLYRLQRISVRIWFVVLAAGAFGLVGAGLVIQDMYRLSPCPLCIFQRLLYVAIGLIALLASAAPAGRRFLTALLALVGLGGVATAGYQTWMQAFPHLANECSFTDPNLIERFVDWLGMQWPTLFLATGFCASRDWEFLGLSIANWSVVAFAGFVTSAVLLLRRKP